MAEGVGALSTLPAPHVEKCQAGGVMDSVESGYGLQDLNWKGAQFLLIPQGPRMRNERLELLYLV